jgi:hypothetical protein
MKRIFHKERNHVLTQSERLHEKALVLFCMLVTLFIFVKIVLL